MACLAYLHETIRGYENFGMTNSMGEVGCQFYLKTGCCKFSANYRFDHPDRHVNPPAAAGETFVASHAAHLNFGAINPAASVMPSADPRLTRATMQLGLGPNILPQRPGEIECDFYIKSGACKFGEMCKYHHPVDCLAHVLAKANQQENVKLRLAGLPRREGAMKCRFYMINGACKFGAACKFDHPPPSEVMSTATTQTSTSGGMQEKRLQEPFKERGCRVSVLKAMGFS